MFLVKYRRKNNEIYFNIITNLESYHYVGNTTSNGWHILGIYIPYKEKFITLRTYNTISRNNRNKSHKRSKFKRIIKILLERK